MIRETSFAWCAALMCLLGGSSAWAGVGAAGCDEALVEALTDEAGRLTVKVGRKDVPLSSRAEDLGPEVRRALNEWAPVAHDLGLRLALPDEAPALVFAFGEFEDLGGAAEVLDDAWRILVPLLPGEGDDEAATPTPATVIVLFDLGATRSPLWSELLDILVDRALMNDEAATYLRSDPSGLTLRQVPFVLQPVWDMAGNAAAGDDEFRLHNELAAKFAHCVLTKHYGQLPAPLLWGAGFLVEQRLFGSSFHFDATGFVWASSHGGWGKRAAEDFGDKKQAKTLDLARMALEAQAGVAEREQVLVWGALDYLWSRDAQVLADLFASLGELQAAADPNGAWPSFRGDPEQARDLLQRALGSLDPKELGKHCKRLD